MSRVTVVEFRLHVVDNDVHFQLTQDDIDSFDIELTKLSERESGFDPMVRPSSFTITNKEYTITMRLKRAPIFTYFHSDLPAP